MLEKAKKRLSLHHSVYWRQLIECSRRFSTFTRSTENASRYDVSQNARWPGDRRTAVCASRSVAHRSVAAHQTASAPYTTRRRSPFATPRALPHRPSAGLDQRATDEPVRTFANLRPGGQGML